MIVIRSLISAIVVVIDIVLQVGSLGIPKSYWEMEMIGVAQYTS